MREAGLVEKVGLGQIRPAVTDGDGFRRLARLETTTLSPSILASANDKLLIRARNDETGERAVLRDESAAAVRKVQGRLVTRNLAMDLKIGPEDSRSRP